MTSPHIRAYAALVVISLSVGALSAAAQAADSSSMPVRECTYASCALSIAPRWNGLAVVRGADARPV